jgi:hypothetical protein
MIEIFDTIIRLVAAARIDPKAGCSCEIKCSKCDEEFTITTTCGLRVYEEHMRLDHKGD